MASWLNYDKLTSGKPIREEKHQELVKVMNEMLGEKERVVLDWTETTAQDVIGWLRSEEVDEVEVLNVEGCRAVKVNKDMQVTFTNGFGYEVKMAILPTSDAQGCSYMSDDFKMKYAETDDFYSYDNKVSINFTGWQRLESLLDSILRLG